MERPILYGRGKTESNACFLRCSFILAHGLLLVQSESESPTSPR